MSVETHEVVRHLKAGRYKVPVTMTYQGDRIFLQFRYNKALIDTVKSLEGRRWHGFDQPNPRKVWSIKNSPRNAFRLDFLEGKNPYEPYDRALLDVKPTRSLYEHQVQMLRHGLTRKYAIFAGEMGLGKSLVFIELLDHVSPQLLDHQIWYVGPKSGLVSVQRELVKWDSQFKPKMLTYHAFRNTMRDWRDGTPAPRVVCFDESSKLKNPSSQQSAAAKHLAMAIRKEHGDDGYVILMSGTPAPKTPVDWWHQCEVACPGYLKESNIGQFRQRLSLSEQRSSLTGGVYPHHLTWFDDETKCKYCGSFKDAPQHLTGELYDHDWAPSINEVASLHTRIKDLALIQFKKDCLDLPDKQFEVMTVKPTVETLRAARLIRKTATRTITALTHLRELSDGFQYTEEVIGKTTCDVCHGNGKIMGKMPVEEVDPLNPLDVKAEDFIDQEIDCPKCDDNQQIDVKRRTFVEVPTPKDEAFKDLLDLHEDGGRFVVWGGFTATIDRLIRIAHQQGWSTLQVDGRVSGKGYQGTDTKNNPLPADDLLDAMDASNPRRQELLDKYPRVCVVGHPKAGFGLTFNISPTALFYSNDFDGEARMQAVDRIHRIGMDVNRGATIIDLIHLPTDKLVLENLKLKKKLQNLTMGEIDDAFTEE